MKQLQFIWTIDHRRAGHAESGLVHVLGTAQQASIKLASQANKPSLGEHIGQIFPRETLLVKPRHNGECTAKLG
jgi:hypothetical protein